MKKNTVVIICGFLLMVKGYCQDVNKSMIRDLEIFHSFYSTLSEKYVDRVHSPVLMHAGIDAFCKLLDPYTVYTDSTEVSARKDEWKGILYSGVGVNIIQRDNYVLITGLTEDAPAQQAGLRIGDRLISVDGFELKGKSLIEIVSCLKGQEGSRLKIVADRPGRGIEEFILYRKKIMAKSISWYGMIDDSTGYIRCEQFLENSYDTLLSAFLYLKKQVRFKRLILDFRDNIGGLVQDAVNSANIFLPKGKVVCSLKSENNAGANYNYTTLYKPSDTLAPVVILANRNTISAGEIFIGAMQDYDRAVIIGQRTYGKGYVQGTHSLVHGAQLYVTSARYYIPSGRCLQAIDLTHNYIDGKSNRMNDSLKQLFFTHNHRHVYNNGGIEPDIILDKVKGNSELVKALYNNFIIADFATLFRNTHEMKQGIAGFSLSEDDFRGFKSYAAKQMKYIRLNTESTLVNLINESKLDGSKCLTHKLDKALKQAERNKYGLLYKSKNELIPLLEKEIIIRYFNYTGEIRYSFLNDQYLLKALFVLNDKACYNKLLNK